MAGFEVNIVIWVTLKPTKIFYGQFRPIITLFDSQYFYLKYSIAIYNIRKNQFSKNGLLDGFETTHLMYANFWISKF